MKTRMLGLGMVAVLLLSAAYMLVEAPSDRLAKGRQADNGKGAVVPSAAQPHTRSPAATRDAHRDSDALPREIRQFEARQAFLDGMQSFLDAPEEVPETQRAETADHYRALVRDHAARGEFSGAEALMLELALLRQQVAEDDYPESAQALMDTYSDDSKTREAAWRATSTDQLAVYKQREQAVMEAVREMDSFPDGMTQGQYLRERLQAEREKLAAGE